MYLSISHKLNKENVLSTIALSFYESESDSQNWNSGRLSWLQYSAILYHEDIPGGEHWTTSLLSRLKLSPHFLLTRGGQWNDLLHGVNISRRKATRYKPQSLPLRRRSPPGGPPRHSDHAYQTGEKILYNDDQWYNVFLELRACSGFQIYFEYKSGNLFVIYNITCCYIL